MLLLSFKPSKQPHSYPLHPIEILGSPQHRTSPTHQASPRPNQLDQVSSLRTHLRSRANQSRHLSNTITLARPRFCENNRRPSRRSRSKSRHPRAREIFGSGAALGRGPTPGLDYLAPRAPVNKDSARFADPPRRLIAAEIDFPEKSTARAYRSGRSIRGAKPGLGSQLHSRAAGGAGRANGKRDPRES